MADSLERRQAEVRFLEEHQRRNDEAAAAEERALAALRQRSTAGLSHPGSGVTFTAAKAAAGAPENKSLAGPGENKNALSGVDFASDAAAEAAIRAGLTAASFKGVKPSGASGYTKADVQKVIG
jgi:hypothetical protein